MARSYTRNDVETRDGRPAVNVKVYGGLDDGFRALERYASADEIPPGFTEEWIRGRLSEEQLDGWFWETCAFEWETIEQDAEEIFGPHVRVVQEGRSGGWAVVEGLDDVDEWDAVKLAKWRRFEKFARAIASDVPYQIVSGILLNVWETDILEDLERARAAAMDVATVKR